MGMVPVRIKTIPFIKRGLAYIYAGPLWRKKDETIDINNLYKILNLLY